MNRRTGKQLIGPATYSLNFSKKPQGLNVEDWGWSEFGDVSAALLWEFRKHGFTDDQSKLKVEFGSFFPPGENYVWAIHTPSLDDSVCYEGSILDCPFPSFDLKQLQPLKHGEVLFVNGGWARSLVRFARLGAVSIQQDYGKRLIATTITGSKVEVPDKLMMSLSYRNKRKAHALQPAN